MIAALFSLSDELVGREVVSSLLGTGARSLGGSMLPSWSNMLSAANCFIRSAPAVFGGA